MRISDWSSDVCSSDLDHRRLGRRFPDRRRGPQDPVAAAAFRLPPALRAQGAVFAEHGAGALDGGTASARRPARQRGHRPANGGGDMKPLDQEQHKPDMEIAGPRVHFLSYQSAEQWAWAGAVTLAAELRRARSAEHTSELQSLMRIS